MEITIIVLLIVLITVLISWRALYLKTLNMEKIIQDNYDTIENDRKIIKETIENMTNEAIRTYARMYSIDQGGSFQTDDEVGMTFDSLKRQIDMYKETLIYIADEWNIKYNDLNQDGEEEKEA